MQTQSEQHHHTPRYIGPSADHSNLQAPARQDRSCREIRQSRSTLLSYVLKLKKSIDANHADLAQAITQRFIQSLTDYISYSHFRLLNSYDAQAHQIVALQNNTAEILPFTEHYALVTELDLPLLTANLEQLALALEVRFEIEDEIVLSQTWQ